LRARNEKKTECKWQAPAGAWVTLVETY